jgi:iron complex outermembrane receptor protein
VGDIPAIYGDGIFNDENSASNNYTSDHEVHHTTRTHVGDLKLDWDMGWADLISQTTFIHYNLGFVDDLDFSPDNTVNFLRDERYDQISQELRLQSQGAGPIEYAAGVFFLGSRWHSLENQEWAVPNFPPPPDPTSGQLFNGPFLNNFYESQRDYSAYASGGWHITPKLKLSGGIRYSYDQKNDLFGRTAEAPFTIWNTIANPPFDPTPLHHDAHFVDGSASLVYAFTRSINGYLSYGHGSKAGGFIETNSIAVPPQLLVNGKVPAALVAANASLKDEFSDSYEVGIKSSLFDRRLRLNIALFKTDITNFQDTVFTGGSLGFITFNDPATSKGVDSDVAWDIGHGLSMDGGATYADATAVIQPIDPLTGALEFDQNGNPIYKRYQRSQAPRWVSNLGINYHLSLPRGLELHGRAEVRHRSGMFNQRQEEYYSPPLTTLNISAGIGNGRWSVDLIAKNVTNAISQDFASAPPDPRFSAFYNAYAASPNQSTTVMLAFSVKY